MKLRLFGHHDRGGSLYGDGNVSRDFCSSADSVDGGKLSLNRTAVIGDENGYVTGLECVEMELGEPDASGRRRPVAKKGSNFVLDVDCVIMAIGTKLNKLILETTENLEANDRGGIGTDEGAATNREGVFAGGDAVTGAATVILAMGAGKTAAASIDEYLEA